ncbi:kunitz-type serine protease inhibitor mulgin-4-like [Drosophila nasuta]|uniref:kunitz-type serine protease inhibitor mulgin-4-like n=1 Tax=Drosophila nasuta TaxID=42062 RepID=UPI00295E556B|nr:kunitz-type serine protease inhibitor mulgin-4-like [Drosophila nasuta]
MRCVLFCIILTLYVGVRGDSFKRKAFVRQPKCLYLVDPGPCHGKFQVYGFDPFANICSLFTYGGCGGNPNRFGDYSHCSRDCLVRAKETEPDDSYGEEVEEEEEEEEEDYEEEDEDEDKDKGDEKEKEKRKGR